MPDIGALTKKHFTLFVAASADRDMDAETVRQWLAHENFLSSCDNPNSCDSEGWTALHLFSQHGNTGAVKALLEGGADPKLIGRSGLSALHVAKNGDIAKLLIDAGAKVNSEGGVGHTPLHESLEELRSYYARDKVTPLNPLGDRCERSREDVIGTVQALIAGGADVNAIGQCTGGLAPLDYAGQIEDRQLRERVCATLKAAGAVCANELTQGGHLHESRLSTKRQSGSSERGVG